MQQAFLPNNTGKEQLMPYIPCTAFAAGSVCLQTFVSRTRLAVQRAEDMTATPFEEDNISVVPSDQGQAPGQPLLTPTITHCPPLCVGDREQGVIAFPDLLTSVLIISLRKS